jgi:Ca2+-binding RTX toxin-like protein
MAKAATTPWRARSPDGTDTLRDVEGLNLATGPVSLGDLVRGPTIHGANGADTLTGSSFGEDMLGGNGDDRLIGAGGSDRLLGGNGRDTLLGGPGADVLEGGNGDDVLFGGAGNDTLTGGRGADLFVASGGHDVVTDFGADDVLLVPFKDLAELLSHATQVGSDVVISNGGSVRLVGVNLQDLNGGDFIFS